MLGGCHESGRRSRSGDEGWGERWWVGTVGMIYRADQGNLEWVGRVWRIGRVVPREVACVCV